MVLTLGQRLKKKKKSEHVERRIVIGDPRPLWPEYLPLQASLLVQGIAARDERRNALGQLSVLTEFRFAKRANELGNWFGVLGALGLCQVYELALPPWLNQAVLQAIRTKPEKVMSQDIRVLLRYEAVALARMVRETVVKPSAARTSHRRTKAMLEEMLFHSATTQQRLFDSVASGLARAGFEKRTWGTIQGSYKEVRRRVREDSLEAAGRYYVPSWFPGETPCRAAYFCDEKGQPTDGWGVLLDSLY
ncbi:MAG: hypothetical protein IH936_02315 [Acidobacteria bacterium]|nr:hypothetical protein [Acidobacteriota bacterium]